jgi:hypothetical protein
MLAIPTPTGRDSKKLTTFSELVRPAPIILSDRSQYIVWIQQVRQELESLKLPEATSPEASKIRERAERRVLRERVSRKVLSAHRLRTKVPFLWGELHQWSVTRLECLVCENFKRLPSLSWNSALRLVSPLSNFLSEIKQGCQTCRMVVASLEALNTGLTDGSNVSEISILIWQIPSDILPLVLWVKDGRGGRPSDFVVEVFCNCAIVCWLV